MRDREVEMNDDEAEYYVDRLDDYLRTRFGDPRLDPSVDAPATDQPEPTDDGSEVDPEP